MNSLRMHKANRMFILRVVLMTPLCVSVCLFADKKASAPAPKAAPAKAAAPARTGGAAASHGPTTGGKVTTSSPHPTTSSPHPTTSSPHPTTSSSHPATSAPHSAGAGAGRPGSTAGAGRPGAVGNTAGRAGGFQKAGAPRAPGHTVHTAGGNDVRMRANGKPGDVHVAGRNMDIHHGLAGGRRVEVVHGDHRIVVERGGHGYYSGRYGYHGHEYAHRTYYYGGRPYDRYYRGYYYRGVYMDVYAPRFYYGPAFYGWAYNPWVSPIYYNPVAWGWAGNPWYGYYGYYFAPYPAYASAPFWLTDYLISTSLAAAYTAQAQANAAAVAQAQAAAGGQVVLTPDVKNLIAEEVKQQIALENAEAAHAQTAEPDPASSSVQRMMTDGTRHVFVANRDLDIVDAGGKECAVSEGDALQLSAPPAQDQAPATLVVLASKGGLECGRGATVSVSVADLQEMQNHMRETIAEGMQKLQEKQGQGGLPTLPAAARTAPVTSSFAAQAPGPDPNAVAQIQEQSQEADRAEQEVLKEVPQAQASGPSDASPAPIAPPAAPPVTLSMGQTIDEVKASMGQPTNIVDLGAKKIYVYPNLKVTFKDGKVTDIQ